MKNFGSNLDVEEIIQSDGFYSSLSDFKRFMLFVLNQYLIDDDTFKMFYNQKTGEFIKDETYKSIYKKIVMERIKLKNIGFCKAGFAYSEDNKELAVVSPEYFMIHFLDYIKKSSYELYNLFLKYQKEYGNNVLDNLSFKIIFDNLYNKYKVESEKTKGLYKLTDDYSETYLRAIILLRQVELTIDNLGNEVLDYFSDDFDEWNDEYYRKVENEIEEKLNNTPRNDRVDIENGTKVHYIDQDYIKLEEEMNDLRQREAQNAFNRFRKKFFENQKIAGSELIRLLQNKFKEIVACYSYLDNQYKRGYINKLGIDEVLYYSHPKDKYNPERLHDRIIGYCAEDYDEMYLLSQENKNDNNNYETVIRNINL